MPISSWKNKIMAACMGLLLLVSLLALIHWGAKKHYPKDSPVTQLPNFKKLFPQYFYQSPTNKKCPNKLDSIIPF